MKYANYQAKDVEKKAREVYGKSSAGIIRRALAWGGRHSPSKAAHQQACNAAYLLCELRLDPATVAAAALPAGRMEKEPWKEGTEAAEIAKGADLMEVLEEANQQHLKGKELARLLLAASHDIRSVFVQLARVMERMRHPGALSYKKRQSLAKRTESVYVPLCHKLGLYELEWECKDLALKQLQPSIYKRLKKLLGKTRAAREKLARAFGVRVQKDLENAGIEAAVYTRAKSFYSIYAKMRRHNLKFSNIEDLFGVRVICNSVEECYRALGVIHAHCVPEGEFDDYIASPKKNGYRSIHTLVRIDTHKVEVQVRTWEMHRDAEEGVAAHWRYKEFESDKQVDDRLSWAKQLVDWQRALSKQGLVRSLKLDVSDGRLFALTPKHEVIQLPAKSTPLDFAFAVHSDIGMRCQKALVNGKMVPLNHQLENGDHVEIITAKAPQASRQWLGFAKSSKARTKIKRALGIKAAAKQDEKKGRRRLGDKKRSRFASCCQPLPGDPIVGYKTTKRKITIHHEDCQNLAKVASGNQFALNWGEVPAGSFDTKIKVEALNRSGLLTDLLQVLARHGAVLKATKAKSLPNDATTCVFDVQVHNVRQMHGILSGLEKVPAVNNARRATTARV